MHLCGPRGLWCLHRTPSKSNPWSLPVNLLLRLMQHTAKFSGGQPEQVAALTSQHVCCGQYHCLHKMIELLIAG